MLMQNDPPATAPKRLMALDVFRGMAIAGMILVNMVSVAAPNVYPILLHAQWHGCTIADVVFPFFLFIMGVAMAFSWSKYTQGQKLQCLDYLKLLRRVVILFGLGLLLNGFWTYDFSTIRVMGVLQRISLVYGFATLIVLRLSRKQQWSVAIMLLIGYWLALAAIPVPGYGAGHLTPAGNFGAYLDRWVIPKAHLYQGNGFNAMGDPEGLFSTLPAIVSTLAGYVAGDWLRHQPCRFRTSLTLATVGLGCLGLGYLWGLEFPINKQLWTSSFVVFTTGWALLTLALCYTLTDVQHWQRWGKPFEVLGVNAIVIFMASVLQIKLFVKTKIGTGHSAFSLYDFVYQQGFASWAGPTNGSLLLGLVTVMFWWSVAQFLYQRRWLLKI
jgi:predicted acyltransferase